MKSFPEGDEKERNGGDGEARYERGDSSYVLLLDPSKVFISATVYDKVEISTNLNPKNCLTKHAYNCI